MWVLFKRLKNFNISKRDEVLLKSYLFHLLFLELLMLFYEDKFYRQLLNQFDFENIF
jgi:hypothetical protein